MSKLTSELLTGVKRRITMPANQVLFQDSDILDTASDLLRLNITKLLKAARQNYLLTTEDIPFVAGEPYYQIPYRSVANGFEDVKYLYTDGITLRSLAYITVEDIYQYPAQATYPEAFYFKADEIGLAPTPAANTGGLRVWYHRQLSSLCLESAAGQVTNISGNDVTISTVPSTFVAGYVVDFVKGKSLSTVMKQDATITNVAGNTLTFGANVIPSKLAIGDWVSPAQLTPVLPIPDEMYDYFEGLLGTCILNSIGDPEGAATLQKEVDADERDVKSLLEPRIDGEPEKIVNYHSLLRQQTFRGFGGFRR